MTSKDNIVHRSNQSFSSFDSDVSRASSLRRRYSGFKAPENGVATTRWSNGISINDNPADATIIIEGSTPSNPDLNIISLNIKYEWKLSEFDRMIDIKLKALKETRIEYPEIPDVLFTKSWITLKDSAIVFFDEHPVFLLAQLLTSNDKKREIHITLHLYPAHTKDALITSGYLYKASERGFGTTHKRWFVIADRTLKYGKEPRGKLKAIPLARSFNIIEDPNNPLSFELTTPGRPYHLQAPTIEARNKWVKELKLLFYSFLDERPAMNADEIDDNAFLYCAYCKRKFHFFSKKYICIVCGFRYCDEHFVESSNRCITDNVLLVANSTLNNNNNSNACNSNNQHNSNKNDQENPINRQSIDDYIDVNLCNTDNKNSQDVLNDSQLEDGTLIVNIIQAQGVKSSDLNGLSDPYCIMYFEGNMYETSPIKETLSPVWKERFEIKVIGTGHAIQIAVLDEDTYTSDDFLGMIYIPLFKLESGKVYDKFYELKSRPGKFGAKDSDIRGKLHVQILYKCPLKSLFKPIVKHQYEGGLTEISPPTSNFSVFTVSHHYSRFEKIWDKLQLPLWKESYKNIVTWKNPPVTLVWMIVYTYVILYLPISFAVLTLPLLLLFFLVANFIHYRFFDVENHNIKETLNKNNDIVDENDEDMDDDFLKELGFMDKGLMPVPKVSMNYLMQLEGIYDDANDENVNENKQEIEKKVVDKRGKFRKFFDTTEKLRKFQDNLAEFCTLLEKFQAIMTWRSPVHSTLFSLMLGAICICLMIVPIRYLLLFGGYGMFVNHLKKRFKLMRQGIVGDDLDRLMKVDSGNEFVNFLSRAPNPWDHHMCVRNLPDEFRK